MSAHADAATADYSKGRGPGRGRPAALRGLAAALALVAVALLLVAEFSTVVRVVVGSLETERRTVAGRENHGYALLVVALAAVPLTLVALRGARSAGAALVALAVVALGVALAVDLPATRESGQLPESVAFEDAHARPGPGLALEIAGGAGLMLAGGMLLLAGGAPPSGARGVRAGRIEPQHGGRAADERQR